MKHSTKLLIAMVVIIAAGIYLAGCAKKQIVDDATQGQMVAGMEYKLSYEMDTVGPQSPIDNAYFDFDKSNLTFSARTKLRANADWINKAQCKKITIEGHCDKRGSLEYNVALGQARADAVRSYYRALGVHAEIRTISFGEEKPVSNIHWLNRRGVTQIEYAK